MRKKNKTGVSVLMAALGTAGLTGLAQGAVLILNTNFNSAAAGGYANASTVNGGGAVTEQMKVGADATQVLQVANVGGTNQVVRFTDNSSSASNNPGLFKSGITGLSTTSSGNNAVVGSFDFRYLLSGANLPQLQFLLSNGGGAGSTTSAIQLLIRPGAGGLAPAGGTGAAIVSGDDYRLAMTLDLSSATQDTWAMTLTNLTTSTVISTQTISTRAPNITPNHIAFYGGVNGAPVNASPFIQIDNVNFSAMNITEVPEPASMALLATALFAGGMRRRRS